jgi:hypothetical protein
VYGEVTAVLRQNDTASGNASNIRGKPCMRPMTGYGDIRIVQIVSVDTETNKNNRSVMYSNRGVVRIHFATEVVREVFFFFFFIVLLQSADINTLK